MIPLHTTAQKTPVVVSAVFAVISSTAVCLRLYAKKKKGLGFQWDDYSIVVALILLLGLITCDIIGVAVGGVGLHLKDVVMAHGPGPLIAFSKDLIAVQILWCTSLMFTKVSILLFYTRIFSIASFRLAARVTAVVVVLWCISVILCSFLLCRPFAFNWDQTIPGGHCGNQILSYELTGTFNICTDVMVLCLPLPVIWNLQMRTANKIGLIGVFAVGFFACIVSIIRLVTLVHLSYADITHSVPEALIWSMLEPAMGITLACLPIIRPLLGSSFSSLSKGSKSDRLRSSRFQPIDDEYPLQSRGESKGKTLVGVHSAHGSTRDISTRGLEEQNVMEGTESLDSARGIVVTQEWTVRD
ncbi:hypothetical protein K432DRAFT_286131 [Lepidopterella palustris CBS 459.81]|uniref:Rhodopsin domain-containing protein n=1 Tax=Lepidopterella palustris CBS 459.81 TaxID=1314670 RepID=A0A8E2ELK1_9PEZI|nr:hypothetical protein K432DRAFT_286131 [Lepidopterella palustris CBS 459.81]